MILVADFLLADSFEAVTAGPPYRKSYAERLPTAELNASERYLKV